jgi:hypothetical protein
MGELEVDDPSRTLELCRLAMHAARSHLRGAKGIESLVTDADMADLAQIRHRDIACSGCPWPCRTFVKYNEPPTVLKEQLKEPGMLISDVSGFLALRDKGRNSMDAARLLEVCSRIGVEPIAASKLVEGVAFAEAKALLESRASTGFEVTGVPSVPGATSPDTFSPFAPNGGEGEDLALAFVLGICPRYVAKVGLDLGMCLELIAATTSLSMGREELVGLAKSLIR